MLAGLDTDGHRAADASTPLDDCRVQLPRQDQPIMSSR